MYSLINLFIHILQHPDISTVQSDLALMDIGAAHFARLEFVTDSEVPIPFAKDIASLARTAVKYHKTLSSRPVSALVPYGQTFGTIQDASGMGVTGENGIGGTPNPAREVSSPPQTSPFQAPEEKCVLTQFCLTFTFSQGQLTNFTDLELDHWCTFLPLNDFDGLSPLGVS